VLLLGRNSCDSSTCASGHQRQTRRSVNWLSFTAQVRGMISVAGLWRSPATTTCSPSHSRFSFSPPAKASRCEQMSHYDNQPLWMPPSCLCGHMNNDWLLCLRRHQRASRRAALHPSHRHRLPPKHPGQSAQQHHHHRSMASNASHRSRSQIDGPRAFASSAMRNSFQGTRKSASGSSPSNYSTRAPRRSLCMCSWAFSPAPDV
jgi:hypothetical protein